VQLSSLLIKTTFVQQRHSTVQAFCLPQRKHGMTTTHCYINYSIILLSSIHYISTSPILRLSLTTAQIINKNDNKCNKYVRLRGQPYIHMCQSYVWPVHTPEPWLPSMHMRAGLSHGRLDGTDSSDFGLLWEQSSPKCAIPCVGH